MKRVLSMLLVIVLLVGMIPTTVLAAGSSVAAPKVSASNVASTGKIKLTWDAVSGAAKYQIYRATSKSGTYSRMMTTSSTSYTNTSAVAGKTYYYKVKSVSAGGAVSGYSNTVSRTCDLPRPEITLSNVASSGKIKVSWDAVSGATGYKVYRSTTGKSGSWTLMKTTTSTSYTNTSAVAGKTYYYKVQATAKNTAANSAYSAVKYRTCDLARPTVTLSNVASSGKIKVSWAAVDGVAKYEVYRSKDNKSWSLLKTTTSTSFTNTSTAVGTTYYYKVRALATNSAANSAYSTVSSATCILARPVLTLGNSEYSGQIQVSWTAVEGAVKYQLYRSTDNKNWSVLLSTTNTSLVNTSTEAGELYYYKVRAIAKDTAFNSEFSTVKSRTCDLPKPSVTLSNVASTGKIKISWSAIEGAVKYEVYRSTDNKNWSLLTTTTSTSVVNTKAVAGTEYFYKVRAIASKSAANSAFSTVRSRTCDLARPTVSVSKDSNGMQKLTWTAVDGAVKYWVYEASKSDGTYTLAKSTTGTSFDNVGSTSGTTYYKVIAVAENTAGNSAYSQVVSVGAVKWVTRYVADTQLTLYAAPENTSESFPIPYMAEIKLGPAVHSWETGTWVEVSYQGKYYYAWLPADFQKLTTQKSTYTYETETDIQREVVDMAVEIAQEWNTVYAHGQSTGEMNSDGTYGFDCSGFVSYVLNSVMRKRVPIYKISAAIDVLHDTQSIYNEGYEGEFVAVDVDIEDIQPGDVVFFSLKSKNDHCGIYLGNGEFAHSSQSWEKGVWIAPIYGRYSDGFSEVRRYLPKSEVPASAKRYAANSYCKLYAEQSDKADVLKVFTKGEAVTVLFTNNGNWAYVRTTDGMEGFMLVKYLSTTK